MSRSNNERMSRSNNEEAAVEGQGATHGSGDEAAPVVDEGDRVDRRQVVVVHVLLLARTDVVLHDLLAGAGADEAVVVAGAELALVGHLAASERVDALAGLRVPQLHVAVPAAAQELEAILTGG